MIISINTIEIFAELFARGQEGFVSGDFDEEFYVDEDSEEKYRICVKDKLHINFQALRMIQENDALSPSTSKKRKIRTVEEEKFSINFNLVEWINFANQFKICLYYWSEKRNIAYEPFCKFISELAKLSLQEQNKITKSFLGNGYELFIFMNRNEMTDKPFFYKMWSNFALVKAVLSVSNYCRNVQKKSQIPATHTLSDSDTSSESVSLIAETPTQDSLEN